MGNRILSTLRVILILVLLATPFAVVAANDAPTPGDVQTPIPTVIAPVSITSPEGDNTDWLAIAGLLILIVLMGLLLAVRRRNRPV